VTVGLATGGAVWSGGAAWDRWSRPGLTRVALVAGGAVMLVLAVTVIPWTDGP
jgi:hypothetical protein